MEALIGTGENRSPPKGSRCRRDVKDEVGVWWWWNGQDRFYEPFREDISDRDRIGLCLADSMLILKWLTTELECWEWSNFECDLIYKFKI